MVITSRTQRTLFLIGMSMIVAILIEILVSGAGHSSATWPGLAGATSTSATTSAQYCGPNDDPIDTLACGSYHVAIGRLLWQREMQARIFCIHLPVADSIALDQLEPYTLDIGNVRAVGGQYVARLIAVKLGTLAAC